MYDFHSSAEKCFEIQLINSREYLVPFIDKKKKITPDLKVLEIGCAEGGVLKAFIEKGCTGYGIELVEGRLELAKKFMPEYLKSRKLNLFNVNIYDFILDDEKTFDIIILKDVFEHIPN